jgi:hypothetical protein
MPAIIILLILKEQLRLVFGATPLQNRKRDMNPSGA